MPWSAEEIKDYLVSELKTIDRTDINERDGELYHERDCWLYAWYLQEKQKREQKTEYVDVSQWLKLVGTSDKKRLSDIVTGKMRPRSAFTDYSNNDLSSGKIIVSPQAMQACREVFGEQTEFAYNLNYNLPGINRTGFEFITHINLVDKTPLEVGRLVSNSLGAILPNLNIQPVDKKVSSAGEVFDILKLGVSNNSWDILIAGFCTDGTLSADSYNWAANQILSQLVINRHILYALFIYPSADSEQQDYLDKTPAIYGMTDLTIIPFLHMLKEIVTSNDISSEDFINIFDPQAIRKFDYPEQYAASLIKKK